MLPVTAVVLFNAGGQSKVTTCVFVVAWSSKTGERPYERKRGGCGRGSDEATNPMAELTTICTAEV